ncbi:hypothetical protein C8R44DRAFT_893195 [Mycena epipterygia]|nr:hypothetical protein C8R44DRAFT_893195 [Mycena epipterygia]
MASALFDVLWTSLLALEDVFPLFKSTVGVIALLEIAERARHSKRDVIADVVPNALAIPPPMLERTCTGARLLDEIRCRTETIALTGGASRVMHLNHNERVQEIKAQLDDAYRDFLAASALHFEVQQAHLTVQQTQFAVEQQLAAQQS